MDWAHQTSVSRPGRAGARARLSHPGVAREGSTPRTKRARARASGSSRSPSVRASFSEGVPGGVSDASRLLGLDSKLQVRCRQHAISCGRRTDGADEGASPLPDWRRWEPRLQVTDHSQHQVNMTHPRGGSRCSRVNCAVSIGTGCHEGHVAVWSKSCRAQVSPSGSSWWCIAAGGCSSSGSGVDRSLNPLVETNV